MPENGVIARRRRIAYLATGMGLTVLLLAGHNSGWRGGAELHTVMEALATLLAWLVGTMALVRYYSKKDSAFLLIGAGFLGTGLLDGYHAILTSTYFQPLMPSDLPSLIPWSWVASRQFLSMLMFLSWLAGQREARPGAAGRISEGRVYWGTAVFTLVSFLFFFRVPLPLAYYPGIFFHRPEEFAPALFFGLALIGYLRKGHWRQDAFEHWLILSLIVGFVSQAVFMSHSGVLFDYEFDVAHALKKISYLCVLSGLLINMYHAIQSEAETARSLLDSEQRLRAVVHNIFDGIVTIDERGRILSINPAVEKIFGYSADQLMGRNVSMLAAEPYRSAHDSYIQNYLRTGRSRIIGQGREVEGLRADGRTFPMELEVAELWPGNERAFLGVIRDIEERKENERRLIESERNLLSIVTSIDDIVFQLDDQCRFLNVWIADEKLLFMPKENFLNRTINEVFGIEFGERFENAIRNLFIDRKTANIEYREPNPPFEKYFNAKISYIPGTAEEKGYAIMLIQDITERKKIDRLKSQFVSTVSHELRTPLTSIKGSLGMVSSGVLKDSEKIDQMIRLAVSNTERLINLVNDLLDIEKLESGSLEFRFADVDVTELVEKGLAANRPFAEEYGVDFELTALASGTTVHGDSDRLTQVLANLLSNAVKFSPAGGMVRVSVVRREGMIRISVADDGPGIPLEFYPRVFERFAQADSSDSRQHGGTGLGLSISRAIVIKHGGEIDFESAEGKGTTFFFDLPEHGRNRRAPAARKASMAGQTDTRSAAGGSRILHIEDDRDLCQMMAALIGTSMDYIPVGTFREALRQIHAEKFDFVIIDPGLPDGNGLELLSELARTPSKDAATIIYSSETVTESVAARVNHVLLKSRTTNEELLKIMNREIS